MKIVSLQAENVKKLIAVEIRPDGNLVEITGKNGQGKTSVLDSIWWALTGTSHIQVAPIRKGAETARIVLDLGEIIVTRTFAHKESGGAATSIVVENAEGARFPSPQRMLDALLGELAFDPLAFARMKPKDQFDQLRRFVPGVDFEAIANANRGDFERRTELNRFVKQEIAAARAIVVPQGTPDEPIDEGALVAELERAGEHNADIERRRANRQRATQDAAARRHEAASLSEQAEELRRRAATLTEQANAKIEEANALDQKIAEAPPLPTLIDTALVRQRIEAARATNAKVRELEKREAHRQRAEQLESQAEALTLSIEQRNAAKVAAIAAAKIPVPGIEFGDGIVLLNGVPFEQASDAEQLRASFAIAAALCGKLRVARIRDGSLLDEDSLKLLAEIADQQDVQVWIERVDGSGRVGFVLEDGHARKAVSETEAAA